MPINSFTNYPMTWRPSLKISETPYYISLAKSLEQDIKSGVLLPGTKLPPRRELADFLDINVSTVSRAFKICANKGLLIGTVGSGTFVAYDVTTNIFIPPLQYNSSLIELGSMIPETMPQEEITGLLQKMLTEMDAFKLFQYAQGEPIWHKEAAASLIARTGYTPDYLDIFTASGGQNAIAAVFAGLLKPGDKLGVDPLVYPGLKSAAKLFAIQLVPIRQEQGEMSAAGLLYAIKNENISGIYVMPDLQNPTTHTMSQAGRKVIANIVRDNDLLLIEDGINSLLLEPPLKPIMSMVPEQTIYLASLSKTVLPALRLAYMVVPQRFQLQIKNALYSINLSQSSIMTELSARLIASGQLDNLLKTRKVGIKSRNRLTNSLLRGFDVCGDLNSLSRWLILPKGVSGNQFEKLALKQGVHIYGSDRFAVGKDEPVSAVRLAICAPQCIEDLRKGLLIIRKILESLK